MPERHVSELLGDVFRRAGMKRALRRAEAVLAWPRVAGPELARFTRATALRDGVLHVDVGDAETAMHLGLQRQRFLDAYHRRFGAREVRDIRFRSGPIESRPAPPEAVVAARPDPEELAALVGALGALDLPGQVASAARRAGEALASFRAARRGEGWSPCPTCGALSPGGSLCDACSRYATEPRVMAAARSLAVSPGSATPRLTDDERAVAIHLAVAALDRSLDELLPHVLAQPALKPQLLRAARCRVALAADTDLDSVSAADLDELPPRVRRVLGAS